MVARQAVEWDKPEDFVDFDAPAGGVVQSQDIEGFWDPDISATRCRPLFARAFDNSVDEKKPSILIVCETTVDNHPVRLKPEQGQKKGDLTKVKKGAKIGIWYKPGLKDIIHMCGIDCLIKQTGELDTDKPNPMKTFELVSAKAGTPIPLDADFRDKSKDTKIPFDVRRPPVEGDIPF